VSEAPKPILKESSLPVAEIKFAEPASLAPIIEKGFTSEEKQSSQLPEREEEEERPKKVSRFKKERQY